MTKKKKIVTGLSGLSTRASNNGNKILREPLKRPHTQDLIEIYHNDKATKYGSLSNVSNKFSRIETAPKLSLYYPHNRSEHDVDVKISRQKEIIDDSPE